MIIDANGSIVSIERFRENIDGEGISTLVALWCCNLDCTYCFNRECKVSEYKNEMKASDVVRILMKDALYYRATNGAVVFGGGEPLMQSTFVKIICEELDKDINIRIETALNAPWEKIEGLIEFVDKWIIDIKDMDPTIYKSYTGKDNALVLENLDKLIKATGKDKIQIRVPRIKDYNSEKNISFSVDTIRKKYDIEPEVFNYIVRDKRAQEKTDDLLDRIIKPQANAYNVTPEDVTEHIKNQKDPFGMDAVIRDRKDKEWLVATYNGIIMADWEYKECGDLEIMRSFASVLDRYNVEEANHLEWYTGNHRLKTIYKKILKEQPDKCYLTVEELEDLDSGNTMNHIKKPLECMDIQKTRVLKDVNPVLWSSRLMYMEPDGSRIVKIIKSEDGYEGELARDYYTKRVLRIANGILSGTQYEKSPWRIHKADTNIIILTKLGNNHNMITLSIDNVPKFSLH